MSYHLRPIPRGEFGEPSKIIEEAVEFEDAILQGCKVMALMELSDLAGAIGAYLAKHHPGTTIADLCIMADITARAHTSGNWTPRR